ncbi:Retrovirus-related Pol polyprotein from transposon RE1-like protein [Drosera capensis]
MCQDLKKAAAWSLQVIYKSLLFKVYEHPRVKKQPKHLENYGVKINQCSVSNCFFVGETDSREPLCYDDAKEIEEWKTAMQEDFDALIKNDTWELVPRRTTSNPVTCKWDYEETISPVVKMVTLDRELFMEQPQGFISNTFHHHVCRLKKALYDLKQAPRAWYGKIAQYLIFCGFKASDSDSSLFVKLEAGACIVVLLHVDDMIITGDDDHRISNLCTALSVRFEIRISEKLDVSWGWMFTERLMVILFVMGESRAMLTPME